MECVLDIVAVGHVDIGCGGMVDCFDVVDEDKDAAREDKQHRDDAEGANGIQAKEDVCFMMVGQGTRGAHSEPLTSTGRKHDVSSDYKKRKDLNNSSYDQLPQNQ